MTHSIETTVTSDADARIAQLYTDLRDAWTRLEAVETIIAGAGSDRAPKGSAAAYEALLTTVGELEDAMRQALSDRVAELDHRIGTALVEKIGTFEFFGRDGALVAGEARLTDVVAARLKCEAMDDAMRRLLDLITLSQIRDETDAATYQDRVSAAFDRLQRAARGFAGLIDDPDRSDEAGRGELATLADLMAELTAWKDARPDGLKTEFARSLIAVDRQVRALRAISHVLSCHRAITAAVATDFCGDENRRHVRDVTQAVATRSGHWAAVALVAAGGASLLADRVLAVSGALGSLETRPPVLIAAFAAVFALSWLVRSACRSCRVKRLRGAMTTSLRGLCELDHAAEEQPQSRGPGDLVRRFARMIADRAPARIKALAAERPSQSGTRFFQRVTLGRFSGAGATQPASRAVFAPSAARDPASPGLGRLARSALSNLVLAGITIVTVLALVAAGATRPAHRISDDRRMQDEPSVSGGARDGGTLSGETSSVLSRAAKIRVLGIRGRLVPVAGRTRT